MLTRPYIIPVGTKAIRDSIADRQALLAVIEMSSMSFSTDEIIGAFMRRFRLMRADEAEAILMGSR